MGSFEESPSVITGEGRLVLDIILEAMSAHLIVSLAHIPLHGGSIFGDGDVFEGGGCGSCFRLQSFHEGCVSGKTAG